MFPRGAILEPRDYMASPIISERSFEFARRTVKLCERLWKDGPAARKVADQLFDSHIDRCERFRVTGRTDEAGLPGQTRHRAEGELGNDFLVTARDRERRRQARGGGLGTRRGQAAQSHDHASHQDWSEL